MATDYIIGRKKYKNNRKYGCRFVYYSGNKDILDISINDNYMDEIPLAKNFNHATGYESIHEAYLVKELLADVDFMHDWVIFKRKF